MSGMIHINMAKYEITFVFSKDNKILVEALKKDLESAKAKIIKEEDWGVKPLAYPIDKKTEAAYLYFEVEIEPAKIKKLEEKLRLEEALIRHLIVRV
jgi:small subunit ribosomal protein S6